MTRQMNRRELAYHTGHVEPGDADTVPRSGRLLTRMTDIGGGLMAALLPFSMLAWIFIAR